jgi:hypothetical protein
MGGPALEKKIKNFAVPRPEDEQDIFSSFLAGGTFRCPKLWASRVRI